MGLNETLDRLKAEREAKDNAVLTAEEELQYTYEVTSQKPHTYIKTFAERVFFQRMLKDINHGMSEQKIDEMIDRSVMIATKLYNRLNR